MHFKDTLIGRFLVFTAVGGVSTAAHYAVLVFLFELADVGATTASTVGFVIGALVNYRLNYVYTFTGRASHGRAAPRFAATAAAGLLLNAGVMAFLVNVASVYYLVAQIAATALCLVWNFAVNHFWSFSPAADRIR